MVKNLTGSRKKLTALEKGNAVSIGQDCPFWKIGVILLKPGVSTTTSPSPPPLSTPLNAYTLKLHGYEFFSS